VNALKVIKS